MAGSLALQVFLAPYKPFTGASKSWDPAQQPTWPASTATLVEGEQDSVLIDGLMTAALDTFERLDAHPWMSRARNELRASGLKLGTTAIDSLTPQQREIARLAAAGLTNKRIGERLFLSPRTVGTHLYQLFPKLGVTSRAALRDGLAQLPTDDPPSKL